jgi:Tfp pilus assembly protein PilF
MQLGNTAVAIEAFEKAHSDHDLELGVLYLASNRLTEARDALDRVPASHPDYPMALFKRAQVSVLLHEEDAPARIAAARTHANGVTRGLIERERLFR